MRLALYSVNIILACAPGRFLFILLPQKMGKRPYGPLRFNKCGRYCWIRAPSYQPSGLRSNSTRLCSRRSVGEGLFHIYPLFPAIGEYGHCICVYDGYLSSFGYPDLCVASCVMGVAWGVILHLHLRGMEEMGRGTGWMVDGGCGMGWRRAIKGDHYHHQYRH